MPKIQFYPLDASYKLVEGRARILVFGKTTNGEQICVTFDDFQPYFWVFLKDDLEFKEFAEKAKKIEFEESNRVYKILECSQVEKKYNGKDVKAVKVIVNIPTGVPKIKDIVKEWDLVKEVHEYDILFVRRFFIDFKLKPMTLTEADGEFVNDNFKVPTLRAHTISNVSDDTLTKPNILALDIETYNPMGKEVVPEKNPIIMLGMYSANLKKVITWKKYNTELDYVEFVDSEAELVERFKEIVAKEKPDVLTGYFSDGFDLPYIITRAAKYNIKLDIGLDNSEVKLSKGRKTSVSIKGIQHIDVFKFVRHIIGRSLEIDSYSLNNVAKELLGDVKDEVDIETLAEVWDEKHEQLDKFCKYNLQDAKLTYELCRKVLPNIIELVKLTSLPMFDVIRLGFSQLVEWFIMTLAPNYNEIAPNKPGYHEIEHRMEETLKGAFVYEPKPGLFKDIAVFDFRSLYPSIITAHNISPSTLNCGCCTDTDAAPVDGKRYWFCKKKKGFISEILQSIITRRMRIKEMMKEKKSMLLEARAQSLKLLANSFYGYLGFYAARWYCIECARATTGYGRYYINKVIDRSKKEGFNVLYGDTDSIFITLNGQQKQDALNMMHSINKDLPGLMELELEDFYPSGIFVSAKMGPYGAKKKYALVNEKGVMKIRGFETVRRNWSFIAKDTQQEVLKIILTESDVTKAVGYVKQVLEDLNNNKVPVEKVVIFTQLSKKISEYENIGPHVAAAIRMQEKGEDVGPGTLIKYVVCKGKGKIRDKVRLPEEVEEYDADYYINNQVIPAVERILNVLGYEKEDLMSKEQSKLSSFW